MELWIDNLEIESINELKENLIRAEEHRAKCDAELEVERDKIAKKIKKQKNKHKRQLLGARLNELYSHSHSAEHYVNDIKQQIELAEHRRFNKGDK